MRKPPTASCGLISRAIRALADLKAVLDDAYAGFHHPAIAPLRQIAPATLAARAVSRSDARLQGPRHAGGGAADGPRAPARSGARATVVGATSGDTGAAAIEAFRGLDVIDIFILHPKGRVTEVQRRQMTSAHEPNVHNIAVEGTFDDCQGIVKALFNDAGTARLALR